MDPSRSAKAELWGLVDTAVCRDLRNRIREFKPTRDAQLKAAGMHE
jgi:hypothetical protein